MNSKVYKCCVVFQCKNTSIKTPEKLFIYVPHDENIRKQWLQLSQRDPAGFSPKSSIYLCEDHFDLENDMDNYMEYHLMGYVSQVRMKPDCLPTKFDCQHHKRKHTSKICSEIASKRRTKTVKICAKKSVESDTKGKVIVAENENSSVNSELPTNEWVSRSDVCRCCLITSGTWDLTTSYMSSAGETEVFNNMLKDCYGVTLSNLSEWGPSRFICDSCANSLRHANEFRRQVLQAEDRFAAYLRNGDRQYEYKIKIEHGMEKDSSAGDFKSEISTEYDIKESPNNTISTRNNKYNNYIAKHHNHTNMVEINTADKVMEVIGCDDKNMEEIQCGDNNLGEIDCDYKNTVENGLDTDSDTPISEMCKEKSNQEHLEIVKEKSEKELRRVSVACKGPQYTTHIVKQISERKRIRLTCETVLQDTTACPFRHHKSWFQCFYCTQDFMEINMLREHTLKNHKPEDLAKIKRYPRSLQIDITDFQCKICSEILSDVMMMVKHFSEEHKKVVYKECIADYKVNTSPYSCHLCCKQYHVFRTLTTHLNEHYANCICDVCGKSFMNSKRLKVHKRTHESGNFPCSQCGKVLKTKTSKDNHMETHSKRQIKCHICLKPMKHYNDRIKHMSEVHNITHKFKCVICGREYNIKHYLATHMRQTHGHKNKKCLECGMAFITNHGLKKHMLKHSGVKAFACTVCSKSYARSYTLREHMRAHDIDPKFARQ